MSTYEGGRSGTTERVARFVVDTRYESLPGYVVAAAKIAIADGIANMLAGSTQPLAAIIDGYSREQGGAPVCTVVGKDFRTSAPSAAFANGVFLHCLDYEVQGQPVAHGTSVLLPPAMALGEIAGAAGRRIIEAYVLGWEIQQRLRIASEHCPLKGYHPPGVLGPIAAAAVAAKMLDLDLAATRMAIGIAASHTGGLTANTGTMVKSTHPGAAARTGVEAALLARRGYVAHDSVLEASKGYADTMWGPDFRWEEVTRELGSRFHLFNPGYNIKRYPAQLYMQWAIEASLNLRHGHALDPDAIASIEIAVPAGHVRPEHAVAKTGLDGKFNFAYCCAVAIADGRVDIDSFSDTTRFSPRVDAVLAKVRVKPDPAIPTNLPDTWAVATATLHDGRVVSEACRNYRGSIANPMVREERLVKFHDCAKRVLAASDIARVIDMTDALEQLPDIRPLASLIGHRSAA